jgi:hypothetical protein
MKLRLLKNVDVDLDKTKLREVWPRYLHRNDVINVDRIESLDDKVVNLVLDDGDVLLEVPKNAFTITR